MGSFLCFIVRLLDPGTWKWGNKRLVLYTFVVDGANL